MDTFIKKGTVLATTVALACSISAVQALTLKFDYTYDTNGFFSSSARRSVLNAAGHYFESILSDDLTAITSGNGNHFTARFTNPSTGATIAKSNFSVEADTLTIFVGGRNLPGSTLGKGGPGGYSASGSSSFLDNIRTRGEAGAPNTDFAPWGGAITFNASTNWYFDPDPSTDESFTGIDFYSVALHELGHVLGIGTAGSWDNLVGSDGTFLGARATAVYGSHPRLDSHHSHWANGTMSLVAGILQEAAMDPSIGSGKRKRFTDLDVAALDDIGWDVNVTPVPLPPAVWLFGSGIAMLLGWERKRRVAAS